MVVAKCLGCFTGILIVVAMVCAVMLFMNPSENRHFEAIAKGPSGSAIHAEDIDLGSFFPKDRKKNSEPLYKYNNYYLYSTTTNSKGTVISMGFMGVVKPMR